jgi:transcription elongation factor Elf1
MGKRKSSRPPPTKTKLTLPTTFPCLFCHHPSINITIHHSTSLAILICRVCHIKWESGNVNNLTEPVDVYGDWVDECERVNVKRQRVHMKDTKKEEQAE